MKICGNMKAYPIIDNVVHIPIDDAINIRYLLEKLNNYVKDVGPRDLRGHEKETEEFISALPDYNSTI